MPPLHYRRPPGGKGAYTNDVKGSPAFNRVLESVQAKNGLVFSAHARERMELRQIHLGEEDIQRLSAAVRQAEEKGARSSLLVYGEIALVANVPSRTIITAVNGAAEREHVFTGIDSAVIVR